MTQKVVKMRSLTIQEKLEIIDMIENGKSMKEVSEEMGMNRNSLHYILKSRDKIREEVEKNPTLSKHKRFKQTKNPELEKAILNFIYEAREKGVKLTGSIIKNVALEASIKMNINNFGASNGWLFSFFKRNGININDFNKSSISNDDAVINETTETEENPYFEISDVQYEVEYKHEMDNSEDSRSDWSYWCKFCGSNEETELLNVIDEEAYELFKTFFKTVNHLDVVWCCQKCKTSFEQTCMFLLKAKVVEDMLTELDEQEKTNPLTEEIVQTIRQQFLEEEGDEQQEDMICVDNDKQMDEDIIYEVDYLDEAIEFKNEEECEVEEQQIDKSTEQMSENFSFKTKQQEDEQQYVYECHVCGENFNRMCFLSNHTRLSHSCLPQVACSCGKYLATWESLMAHKRKHSIEPADWICDICNAKFQTKTGLSIHIKFKHDQKKLVQYICNICNREFKDATVLKNHARTHLLNDEKFQFECNICSKKLSNKYSLRAHISTVHEKQKTISCHLCTKGFSNKSNLRSHLISHTTEYIACNICNQVFKNRVSLQSHKKIHKPRESLNFACIHCDKKFHNRNHLERHMISHSSEKKYKCSKCDAAYKWEKDLKNHESIHNSDKKHQCEYCNRFFNDIANVRKHKLRYHQSELV